VRPSPGRSGKTVTRKTAGIKIQMGDFPEADQRPGIYDQSGYVKLNKSHTRIAEYWHNRNVDSLILVVGAIGDRINTNCGPRS
jgi:hypothetical protein